MKRIACIGVLLCFSSFAVAQPADDDAKAKDCKALPKDKSLKLHFKPDTALIDVISLYASTTCKRLNTSGNVAKHRVTIAPRNAISVAELGQLVRTEAQKAGLGYDEDEKNIRVRAPQ